MEECFYGVSLQQITAELTEDELELFGKWFTGQTGAICEGQHCAEAHGFVVYKWDFERFKLGLKKN